MHGQSDGILTIFQVKAKTVALFHTLMDAELCDTHLKQPQRCA